MAGRAGTLSGSSGTAHDGLAGTNGAAINRLPGNRADATRGRHSGTRRRGAAGWPGYCTGLLQTRQHGRIRRNYGRAAGCPARLGRT